VNYFISPILLTMGVIKSVRKTDIIIEI